MAIKKILKQSGSFLFVKFLNDSSLFTFHPDKVYSMEIIRQFCEPKS